MNHELDPASLAVRIAQLTGVAEEMGAVLRRAAHSPNIKERADCSAALFTPAGELLVQAEHIPVHLGAMPASVAAAIEHLRSERIALARGVQIIVNDPFRGGTHLNDVTLVAPVVSDDGGLVAWVANRAHHADVGGTAPGSMPADATDIAEEGFRTPPVLLDAAVEAAFVGASRTPAERRGDLAAQRGANDVGARRVLALAAAPEELDAIVDYGERRMRAALHAFPDTDVVVDDVIDSIGAGGPSARIVCRLRIADGMATFDFTGSSPQRAGNVHAVEAVTLSAAAFALRCATDPTIPANGGALRPLRVVAPTATIVNAVEPVAVGAGNVEVSQRVADVCLRALATVAPDVGAQSQGTMNNLLVGNDHFVYYETIGGGQGANPHRDGMSGVHTNMTNTLDTPVEALERAYPLRVRRYALRPGSGGAGAHRGGDGIEKEYEFLERVTVSLITERRTSAPAGLAGGGPGGRGENWLLAAGVEAAAVVLDDKCTMACAAGDVLRIRTPGGGGHGLPPG